MNKDRVDDFLRAICERPDDDAPRLIYADWLEEQGDWEASTVAGCIRRSCDRSASYAGKRRVAEEIVNSLRWKETFLAIMGFPSDTVINHCGVLGFTIGSEELYTFDVARGFVSALYVPPTFWMSRVGDELVGRMPLEYVSFTSMDPYPLGRQRCFWAHPDVPSSGGVESGVPEEIFTRLEGYVNRGASPTRVRWYDSREDAYDALSDAIIDHAREIAGMPPWRRKRT